jgi:hypothetical protein
VIITIRGGKSFDTDRDLSAPERHILQKLFLWESIVSSLDQFREKQKQAMQAGWNDSGPIGIREPMRAIIAQLEEKVSLRLGDKK